jgi:hypothetical protein
MDTLRDFLLERILEEETLAQAAIDAHATGHSWDGEDDADSAHFARWNPWRVLSSCVAKRLIIAAHRDVGAGVDRRADPARMLKAHACSTCGQYDEYAIEWPCYTLKVLALDWVEHPSYRQEWRPQRLSSGVGRAPAASAMEQAPAASHPASPSEPAARQSAGPGAAAAKPPTNPGRPASAQMAAPTSGGPAMSASTASAPTAPRQRPGEPAA